MRVTPGSLLLGNIPGNGGGGNPPPTPPPGGGGSGGTGGGPNGNCPLSFTLDIRVTAPGYELLGGFITVTWSVAPEFAYVLDNVPAGLHWLLTDGGGSGNWKVILSTSLGQCCQFDAVPVGAGNCPPIGLTTYNAAGGGGGGGDWTAAVIRINP